MRHGAIVARAGAPSRRPRRGGTTRRLVGCVQAPTVAGESVGNGEASGPTTSEVPHGSAHHPVRFRATALGRRLHPQQRPRQARCRCGGRGGHARLRGGHVPLPEVPEPPQQFVMALATTEIVRRAAPCSPRSSRPAWPARRSPRSPVDCWAPPRDARHAEAGSLAPTEQGLAIAKDSWLLGIGVGLMVRGTVDRAVRAGCARPPRRWPRPTRRWPRPSAGPSPPQRRPADGSAYRD